MRAGVLGLAIAALLSGVLLAAQGTSADFTGTVVSEDGAPLADVTIVAWHHVKTDATGTFDLPDRPGKITVIYFDKEGFRSAALVVRPDAQNPRIVLEDDLKSAWTLPVCAAPKRNAGPPNLDLLFDMPPKGWKIRKVQDADYQETLLAPKGTPPWDRLELWWLGLVTAREELLENSVSFSIRSIRITAGRKIGDDIRGEMPNGNLWRAAGFQGLSGGAYYQDVSKGLAKSYDEVIESACQSGSPRN